MSTDNAPLVQAIERLSGAFGEVLEARLRAVLDALVKTTLFAGEDEEGLSVVESRDGAVMLALFTDATELHFFDPGGPQTTITASEAIGRVAAGEYDGLVINPGTKQFDLTREDVLDLFDVG